MRELLVKPALTGEFNKPTPSRILPAKTLILVLALLVLFNPALFAQQKTKPKNVLVLATYSPTAPVAHLWDRGIRSVFEAGTADRIKIDVEHLDLIRLQDEHYVRLLLDLYRHKYSKIKPDLIIPIYNGALGFVLRYGSDLFPDIPIVFGGVEKQFVESRTLGPHISGVLNVNSYRETLDLALDLHPGTRHVAIVAGAGIIGRAWGSEARKSYRSYENRIDFIELLGLPMSEILEKVANLPPQIVIIYITLLEDGDGNKFTAPESLSQISHIADAPIYSFWDLVLGHGIVGGFLSNAEEKGKEIAELGLRILNGEKPADLPIIQESNLQYKFDWRQLKRWSIPEDGLPPGSIVRFKEFTVWDRYKGRILAASALLALQFLLIAGLSISMLRRRRSERSRDELLKFEALMAELSSDLINIAADKVDAKINRALGRIGTFLNVDRSFLFQFNWDKTEFRISHLWEADGIQKDQVVRGVIVKRLFPWLAGNLLNGRDILIPAVAALSAVEEAQKEYQYCRQLGIQSFLILPIQVEDSPLCAIGLDSIRRQRKWSPEVQDRLRFTGEILANTLARSHAEERIKATELKYRTVADFTYDWEYWANFDGTLQYVSPSCERITGYTPHDFVDNPSIFREIIVSEDREIWDSHYHDSRQEFKAREIQFRIQTKDGEIRWIEHACQPIPDNLGGFSGIRASNRDITDRKKTELSLLMAFDEIKELKEQLESERTYLQEEIKLEHNFENIIGQSEELKYVLYQVEQVAATDSSALILGETGTGKELVARAIHKLSSRSNRVLVKVNCAALPADLIESELFGREKGAFTGATTTQIGRFELAKGSTIFLDEIGELPLTLQAKLLRVYESGEFERLGSPKTRYSDARIIAATNRNLEDEVRQGRFREDLWYRLKVFTVTLPPLRRRKADIPLLIKWFMDQISRKMGKPAVEIPKHTIQALQDYHWPGNVRELKNMVESALITARANKINLEIPQTSDPTISDFKPFEEMERDYILQVLKAKNWKVQGANSAASVLEMNPNTLSARIKKLGIKKQAPQ